MILEDASAEAPSAIEEHIVTRYRECGAERAGLTPDAVREVARAVEYYVTVDQGAVADSSSLTRLTTQALADLGEEGAARRFLVYGSGLVRPAEWEIRRGHEMWVLDLRQITVESGAALEIVQFSVLAAVLRAIAELWDATRGQGVLGMRNLRGASQRLVGTARDADRRTRRMTRELEDWCRHVLGTLRGERGWLAMPEVINLDG